MASTEIEQQVQARAEQYPYPLRSPEEDARRTSEGGSPLASLRLLQHFGRGGRAPVRPMRILVAGAGTGDATVDLGAQLQDAPHGGEIVHLERSESAIGYAVERVERLGIRNVSYRFRSLDELDDDEELGTFDYIVCDGGLDGVADPWAAMTALRDHLTDDGVLGVSVYGAYGRHGLAPAKELVRRLSGGGSIAHQIAVARRVLPQLSERHPLSSSRTVGFDASLSDSEIVERYLHPRDRGRSVPEIVQGTSRAGLRIVDFALPLHYDPILHVADPWLVAELAQMPQFDRYAVAELWSFHLARHAFFAVRDDNPVAPLEPGPDVVAAVVDADRIARALRSREALQWTVGGAALYVPVPATALHLGILGSLDGRRTLQTVALDLDAPWERFSAAFGDLYRPLAAAGSLTLSLPLRIRAADASDPGAEIRWVDRHAG